MTHPREPEETRTPAPDGLPSRTTRHSMAARAIRLFVNPSMLHRSAEDARVAAALDGLLASYLVDFQVRLVCAGEALILFCRDRGTATEMRFLQRDILKMLAATGHGHLKSIRIRLTAAPADPGGRAEGPIEREISASNRNLLRSAATQIADPALRSALHRLADSDGSRRS